MLFFIINMKQQEIKSTQFITKSMELPSFKCEREITKQTWQWLNQELWLNNFRGNYQQKKHSKKYPTAEFVKGVPLLKARPWLCFHGASKQRNNIYGLTSRQRALQLKIHKQNEAASRCLVNIADRRPWADDCCSYLCRVSCVDS